MNIAQTRSFGVRGPARARSTVWGGLFVFVLLTAGLLTGCNTAKVTSQQTLAPGTATKPQVVYVTDFDLSAEGVQHEQGLLPTGPGPLGRVEGRLSGAPQDPAARARQLVDMMSDSVVKDLNQSA
jgi:hypothetical protein